MITGNTNVKAWYQGVTICSWLYTTVSLQVGIDMNKKKLRIIVIIIGIIAGGMIIAFISSYRPGFPSNDLTANFRIPVFYEYFSYDSWEPWHVQPRMGIMSPELTDIENDFMLGPLTKARKTEMDVAGIKIKVLGLLAVHYKDKNGTYIEEDIARLIAEDGKHLFQACRR